MEVNQPALNYLLGPVQSTHSDGWETGFSLRLLSLLYACMISPTYQNTAPRWAPQHIWRDGGPAKLRVSATRMQQATERQSLAETLTQPQCETPQGPGHDGFWAGRDTWVPGRLQENEARTSPTRSVSWRTLAEKGFLHD